MKKIEKMTSEQAAMVPVYLDKHLKNGYRTDEIDRAKAAESVRWLYRERLKKPEPIIWYSDSPFQALATIALLREKIGDKIPLWANLGDNLGDNLGANLGDNLGANLGANLRDNLRDNLGDNLGANLRDNLWANLWDNLGDNLWDNLGDNLRDNLGDNLRDNLGDKIKYEYFDAMNWDHYWVGFYDFILHELFPKEASKYDGFRKLIEVQQSLHIIYPFEGVCFVVNRPKSINLNAQKRLHKDGAMAMEYRDGYGIYLLNGVRVPREIAETKAGDLSTKLVLTEKNAQVRAEIVKKIGMNRVMKDLDSRVIDKRDEYELVLLDLKDGRHRPYLKMKNPSVDLEHIEGVHPDCKTVSDALAWRNGLKVFTKPVILT